MIQQRYDRHRQRNWDARHMASATCRLRVEDYQALQMAATGQDTSPACIIRRLIAAYLAVIGLLPDKSPLWTELGIDSMITPYWRRKSWAKAQKMGRKAKKVHDKIIAFPATQASIDSTDDV